MSMIEIRYDPRGYLLAFFNMQELMKELDPLTLKDLQARPELWMSEIPAFWDFRDRTWTLVTPSELDELPMRQEA